MPEKEEQPKKLVIKASSEKYYVVGEKSVDISIEMSEKTVHRNIGTADDKATAAFMENFRQPLAEFVGYIDTALTDGTLPASRLFEILTQHLKNASEQAIREIVAETFKPKTDRVGVQVPEDEVPADSQKDDLMN
jgi:hypothetical protein